jgi:hypothetical protein
VLWIVGHPTAGDFVVSQCDIDASPEISVSDRLDRTEVFPAEVGFTPFTQSVLQTASNVAVVGNHGDFAGLIEGFETSDHGDKSNTIGVQNFFVIAGFDFLPRFHVLEDKPPAAIDF